MIDTEVTDITLKTQGEFPKLMVGHGLKRDDGTFIKGTCIVYFKKWGWGVFMYSTDKQVDILDFYVSFLDMAKFEDFNGRITFSNNKLNNPYPHEGSTPMFCELITVDEFLTYYEKEPHITKLRTVARLKELSGKGVNHVVLSEITALKQILEKNQNE